MKPTCPPGTHPPPVSFKALSLVHYSVMYTTPLSTLISSCSLNHHIYADDNQLFLSFLPTHLDSSIDHLHNALDRISSWMTANVLTLNSSKTEFLLIGFSKQLAKINNSSLTITHSARNLGFIFDEYLTFSGQISSVSKSCYCHIRQLRCIRVKLLGLYLPLYMFCCMRASVSGLMALLVLWFFPLNIFIHSFIPRYQNSFHHRHFHCSLQARLLQLSLSQPAQVSDHPAPTDPELSCTCCCQSSQIMSHHSHPPVSTLAKDK